MSAKDDGPPVERDVIPASVARRCSSASRTTSPHYARRAIIEAAVRVLEREGMDGLSMRRVAGELNAGRLALLART
jgi:hypothetical protein